MTKPIRVLYEIHPHILGGTEWFLARFLEVLDRRTYEPVVVSQKMGQPLQLIHSMDIGTEVLADFFKVTGVRQLVAFIKQNRIGLTQSNYYSSQLAMASNLAGVPHVWRLGGHLDFSGSVRNPKDGQSALEMIRMLSTSIVCNSNFVMSQFRRRSGGPPIQVIPNGIATPVRGSREKHDGRFRIGMAAHFTPQKRHLDFIQAAELVAEHREDVSFAIFGDSYADAESRIYANKVRRWGRGLERRGKLSISDYVGSEPSLLTTLDLLIQPSVRESFSNAILEAMAAGTPAVATRSGGNGELVEHRRTGLLVPPMKPEALARAILLLIKKPELRVQMGEAAQNRAQTNFLIDDCARRYEQVYSKAIFNSGRK